MKRIILVFGIIYLIFVSLNVFSSNQNDRVTKVVIDAGHGGYDPGAVGKNSREKHIALAIALKVGKYIEENFNDVEVIYTRKTDVFVELYKRAKIANDNKADLFISIHANSINGPGAIGTETYVMGLSSSKANLAVAKKENASILLEDNYVANYDGFDPNSPESNIIFSLYQNAYLNQSLNLAANVQKQFKERVGRRDRGVKQAGFAVLYKTTMPAILIETGFISNPKEEAYLLSDKGQTYIASAIYRAFKEYKFQVEGFNNRAQNELKSDRVEKKRETVVTTKVLELEPENLEIIFRIQFASSIKDNPVNAPEFKGLNNVYKYYQNGFYKYTVGEFETREKADGLQHKVRQMGFSDAFVVAFLNGERISVKEAILLLKK